MTASNLVTLSIDDVEVSVEPGTLIIRAAEQSGVRIPRFCDHPLLEPVAACRQCLVEVGTPDREGNLRMMPKPQPSCAITVSAGMVVKTQHSSEVAMAAQKGVMEFLLINHPLDCPICDKGGECPLQNQAMLEGRDSSRFIDAKRVYPKPMHLTSQVLLDRDRCILCQRCVRFGKEIPGDAFLDLQGRGGGTAPTDDHVFVGEQIGAFDAEVLGFHVSGEPGVGRTDISGPFGGQGIVSSVCCGPLKESEKDLSGRTFGSYFSGNVIQICPVGALTSASYRFRSRPFDLSSTPSVTEHDASGSTIRVDVRRGEVVRRMAGEDPQVNEEWITDKDRFAFHWHKQDRLSVPLVREDGKLVPTSWSDAFERVASHLAGRSEDAVSGLLPGGRLTFEDSWAWSRFAREALDTNNVDFRWREQSDEEAQFLGAAVAGRGLGVTYQDVEAAPQVVLIGLEPEDECGSLFLRLRKGVTSGRVKVLTVAPFLTRGAEKLSAELLQARPGEESVAVEGITSLEEGAIILVGERATRTPGLLSAACSLAKRTGAKLHWVPRRSGDRAAVEAGLLPNLGAFGRPAKNPGMSAAKLVEAAAAGKVDTLFVGGLDLRDWPNPEEARAALNGAGFVVALEVRRTEVAELADVVFPVAPAVEKNGTFINWEGRLRPFGQAFSSRSLTDRDILGELAERTGLDLGVKTLTDVYDQANPLMTWDGERLVAPTEISASSSPTSSLSLIFHKVQIDLGCLNDGADHLAGSARRPVALVSKNTLEKLDLAEDQLSVVTGPRGSVRLPVESAEMPDDVLWLPECSVGSGVHEEVGTFGSAVTITADSEGSR